MLRGMASHHDRGRDSVKNCCLTPSFPEKYYLALEPGCTLGLKLIHSFVIYNPKPLLVARLKVRNDRLIPPDTTGYHGENMSKQYPKSQHPSTYHPIRISLENL
jgi:hypothetical protein